MKQWHVAGPGGVKWSIFDYGDEMSVNAGPYLLSRMVAHIPQPVARRLNAEERWSHVVSAAGSIHTAVMAGWDEPIFHQLWEFKREE